jgi:hypothetical protein
MIILNPDQISVFHDIGDFLCEFLVGFTVGVPRAFVEVDFTGMVME